MSLKGLGLHTVSIKFRLHWTREVMFFTALKCWKFIEFVKSHIGVKLCTSDIDGGRWCERGELDPLGLL